MHRDMALVTLLYSMGDVDEQFTFANRSAMREQLWKAVREIWPQVIQNEHDLS